MFFPQGKKLTDQARSRMSMKNISLFLLITFYSAEDLWLPEEKGINCTYSDM